MHLYNFPFWVLPLIVSLLLSIRFWMLAKAQFSIARMASSVSATHAGNVQLGWMFLSPIIGVIVSFFLLYAGQNPVGTIGMRCPAGQVETSGYVNGSLVYLCSTSQAPVVVPAAPAQ